MSQIEKKSVHILYYIAIFSTKKYDENSTLQVKNFDF